MAENDQEKTEQATPKRQRDAREKGQVVVSREVSSALVLLGAMLAFYASGAWMFQRLAEMMRHFFGGMGTISLRADSLQTLLFHLFIDFFLIVFPVMLAAMIIGVAANVMQVGFTISTDAMSPKLSKLNPLQGIGKLLSLRSAVDLLKSLIKIVLLGWLSYSLIRGEIQKMLLLMRMDIMDIWTFIGETAFRIGLYIGLAMVAIAALDYLFQWWQHQKDLRMTKQEIKDESKQTEGDPKIKSRIRYIQLEMSRRRMMQSVPGATVVITNPTHLAIALIYDSKRMQAPKVVAKGAGFIAQTIKDIARSHSVPIVENKPLARTLFKTVDLGAYIPFELYKAVAEILAYVYRLKGIR